MAIYKWTYLTTQTYLTGPVAVNELYDTITTSFYFVHHSKEHLDTVEQVSRDVACLDIMYVQRATQHNYVILHASVLYLRSETTP